MLLITITILLIGLSDAVPNDLKLKTVLALSRHNVRTPLTENLRDFTPKKWPKWDKGPALLTEKGALLESQMAEYFHRWLVYEDLLPESCPEGDAVYIYSNTKPRTKDTAKAFAKSAFRDCNVIVHHLNTEEMDPVFNPVIHNTSAEFEKLVTEEMEEKINALDLIDALKELSRIINLKESRICKEEGICDFSKENNTVVFKIGEELDIKGPLKIGNSIVDSFIMSYYDGKPEKDVAWGEITSPEQWEILTKISKENQNVRFNLTRAARDVAGPLLKYMSNIFMDSNSERKFTLLVGHDSNLNPVIKSFDFQPFVLPNQYEPFPIGGMLVFEKWTNASTDYLKIEYIYESWTQLRDGAELNFYNPPERVLMELKGCKIDDNGFCPWSDFVQVLNDLL